VNEIAQPGFNRPWIVRGPWHAQEIRCPGWTHLGDDRKLSGAKHARAARTPVCEQPSSDEVEG
jgi:hypothetical protein